MPTTFSVLTFFKSQVSQEILGDDNEPTVIQVLGAIGESYCKCKAPALGDSSICCNGDVMGVVYNKLTLGINRGMFFTI